MISEILIEKNKFEEMQIKRIFFMVLLFPACTMAQESWFYDCYSY